MFKAGFPGGEIRARDATFARDQTCTAFGYPSGPSVSANEGTGFREVKAHFDRNSHDPARTPQMTTKDQATGARAIRSVLLVFRLCTVLRRTEEGVVEASGARHGLGRPAVEDSPPRRPGVGRRPRRRGDGVPPLRRHVVFHPGPPTPPPCLPGSPQHLRSGNECLEVTLESSTFCGAGAPQLSIHLSTSTSPLMDIISV